ncbi:uncharacterized protein F5891DRAFT_1179716 [Suillus fuscotomentosus]|uniref:Uncharacterized protein n=1 Tax=Suillus fuscotomentosus TaxID=1912939 RepID=A0AAD4HTX7_9AGAM|nr:uncharacterized protein F5891DRAFT_1179716 [Suillus fuscotomentosus]KAG1908201.1 hypothetical protein F5891DRAFT_1179716 [Suillus fuscotomentosus]
MVHPNTHPKNATQHPGEILLQNKQKRCTAHEVKEEKDQMEQEQQGNEAAAKCNTERIASIEDKMALKELKTLMDTPKPQPHARPIQKKTKLTIEDNDEIAEGTIESKDNEMMDVATDDNNGIEDFVESDDEGIEVQPRKKCVQKMAHHEAVQDVKSINNKGGVHHNKSSQYSELRITSDHDHTIAAHGDPKGKKVADVSAIKDNFAGMGKTKDWAEKLVASKLLRPQSLQAVSRVSSVTTSTVILAISKMTSTSAHSGPPPTPTTNRQGNLQEPTTVFFDSNDSLERKVAFTATKKPSGRSTTSADIMEVQDSLLSPPPPIRRLATKKRTKSLSLPPSSMQPSRATARLDTTLISSLLMDINSGNSSPSEDIILPSASVEVKNNKSLTTSAKQCLMEWCGGFGVAACSILTAFFAQDADFLDPVARVDFLKAMLKQNRFVFRDNSGLIPKNWMGMWRSPFVLQTFTSHLNFTFGCVEIPTLDTKNPSARAAFALTVTAISLDLDFNCAKTDDSDVWTPVIAKGEQYSFRKPIWGGMTLKFMGLISALSDNDFASIVEEAQQYAKNLKNVGNLRTTTSVAPDKDDIFADLFAFH